MKYSSVKASLALVTFVFCSSNLAAEPAAEPQSAFGPRSGFSFGAQYGFHFFDEQFFEGGSLRNRPSLGIRMGMVLSPRIELEAPFTYVGTRAGGLDLDVYTYGLNVVGNLLGEGRFTPYASLGFGGYTTDVPASTDAQHELQINYAAGAKYFIVDRVALRAEFRGISVLTDIATNLEMTLGLVAYNRIFESRDRDHDGILDKNDQCIDVPEDKDGFEDNDGCPEDDNDKDGIFDTVDKCPNEPETFNGVLDEDGCPDIKEEKFSGVIPGITFAFGSAVIEPSSYPILDEAAEVLSKHKDIKVLIEGHTDNKGSAAYNLKLSERRADSVRQYLAKKGLNGGRITIIGYGFDKPIATNTTGAGRAKNRRIEFKLSNQ